MVSQILDGKSKRLNSSDAVYLKLRAMIDNLELFPGARITETEIARLLSVSRTPIREALQRLQLEGQVDVIPKQGCFIRNIDIDLINKFYDVRVTLEAQTIELACELMPAELLENMMAEWSPENLKNDYIHHIKTIRYKEESFHLNIAVGSGNQILGRYLEDVHRNIRVVRWLGFPDMDSIRDTYEEHFELCQIICSGNKRLARSAMKKHIQKSQKLSKKVTLQQLAENRTQYLKNQSTKEMYTKL
jgi:DNA-binding GntR family transcriptional regulator